MVARDYQDGELIPLCTQCIIYLTVKEKVADTMELKFPGYNWKLYSKNFQLMVLEKQKLQLIMPKVWSVPNRSHDVPEQSPDCLQQWNLTVTHQNHNDDVPQMNNGVGNGIQILKNVGITIINSSRTEHLSAE